MKVIRARKAFLYAGARLSVGERFEATDKDAALLIAIGQAEDIPPREEGDDSDEFEEDAAANAYGTKVVKRTQGKRGKDKKPRKKRGPGTYLRRDMRAEE